MLPTHDCGRDATLLSLDEPPEVDGHPAYGSWKHVAALGTKALHQTPNAGAGCHQSLAQSEQWQRPGQDDQQGRPQQDAGRDEPPLAMADIDGRAQGGIPLGHEEGGVLGVQIEAQLPIMCIRVVKHGLAGLVPVREVEGATPDP